MPNTSLFVTLITVAVGCGKYSPDKMCNDMCDDFKAWSDECSTSLDSEDGLQVELDTHETCISKCIEGYEDADKKDCDVQFKAYVNCMNSAGFGEMECDGEAFFGELITACATQWMALNTCTDESTGSSDTGPS